MRNKVEFYPTTPGVEFESRISIKVNGERVNPDYFKNYHPFIQGHFYESCRIRFAADGAVDIKLDIDVPSVTSAVLRCVGKDIPLKISGSSLSFTLPGPGNYYLQLPVLAKPLGTYTMLFFIDDLSHIKKQEEMLKQGQYINICDIGVVSDINMDQTTKIQNVLNRGGKILFPAGIYRTGNLNIVSNTGIFLAKGAILKGTDNYHNQGVRAFIEINDAGNVKISGQGIIDANGMIAYDKAAHTTIHGFNISGCQNIHFEDFTIQGTNSWCIDIRYSKFFTADNVKIFSGKDGVDPDASQDVILKNLSIQSLDDAIAVKNRYPEKSTTERITMKNCIVTSVKSSLKVGTESRALIKDVTFEDVDVYDGERGIVLYALDGGPIENVTWRNIRMSMIDWKLESASGTPFHLNIKKRLGNTIVKNCLIENVHTNSVYRSQFSGLPDAPLDGIRMKNIHLVADVPKKDSCYLFECLGNVNIEIENLNIDWQQNKGKWLGVSSGNGLIIKN